jgi:hypothetical protein
MSFQWIIDNAVDVQINKRGIVAQTIARDQTVRAVSRGGAVWRFTVTPSPGMRWSDTGVRAYIEAIDTADRVTPTTINFDRAEFNYLFGYLGTQSSQTGWSATATQGNNTVSVSGGSLSSGYRFKAGDLIQFSGQDSVYSVSSDVAYNATTMTLNRPVLETSGTYGLITGRNVNWKIICTQLPDYKITPLGIIEWSGPFVFIESLA